MTHIIDNPGGGDCGFYAFSIGLINIIQQEYIVEGISKTFNLWQDKDLKGVSLQDIINIDLSKLYQSPGNYKKELLVKLQLSLRNITVNAIKSDLFRRVESEHGVNASHTLVEGSTVYCKFMELVQFYLHNSPQQNTNQSLYSQFLEFTQYVYNGSYLRQKGQFNELALSSSVLELAHKTAMSLRAKVKNKSFAETQRIENTHVKDALLEDLMYGSDSVILKGTDKIKDQGRWATHDDLKGIAEQLKVNLHIMSNTNGALIFDYPTVTLKNQRNSHWTTLVAQLQSTSEVTKLAEEFTKFAEVAAKDVLDDKLVSDMRYDVQIQAESPLKEPDAIVVTNGSPNLGVQRAIRGLTENKDLMALLDSDKQFLNQLGTVSVTQGLIQLSSGNFETQIARLSSKNQVAVLETILLLFNCDDHIAVEDIALVSQFLANVVKQIQDLQEDKKEHVPLVTEVDESVSEVDFEREPLEQQQIELEHDKLQDDTVNLYEPSVNDDDSSSCNLSSYYSFFKKHMPSGSVVEAGVVAATAAIVHYIIS